MRAGAEPYRAKIVEPIVLSSREERLRWIEEAGYNLFALSSEQVIIDLLTDSGTGAMSDSQWAGMFLGDEAYAGSANFRRLRETVARLTGFEHVIPTHQGRGAENVLFSRIGQKGQAVVGNTHFDTTRAHIVRNGLRPVNLPVAEAGDATSDHPFKGNVDVAALEKFLQEATGSGNRVAADGERAADVEGAGGDRPGGRAAGVACIIVTVTNNAVGGQPVSLENLRAVRRLADEYGVPLFLDAARIAENAWFIQQREPGCGTMSVREIIRAMTDLADGMLMSAKKDGLVNIGGFIAVRDKALYDRLAPAAVAIEGFLTYGGLAGRDMEALARGLEEVVDEEYLAERIGQVAALGRMLDEAGVPVLKPFGGHAVYLDMGRFVPHLKPAQLPGQAVAVHLYIEGGVRAVEVGTVMAGRDPETGGHRHPPLELVRLAIPRRVYTDLHMQYVARIVQHVWQHRDEIRGMRIVEEPPYLRHFLAKFAWED